MCVNLIVDTVFSFLGCYKISSLRARFSGARVYVIYFHVATRSERKVTLTTAPCRGIKSFSPDFSFYLFEFLLRYLVQKQSVHWTEVLSGSYFLAHDEIIQKF